MPDAYRLEDEDFGPPPGPVHVEWELDGGLDPVTLRNALEMVFDRVANGLTADEAIDRTVATFERLPVAMRTLDAITSGPPLARPATELDAVDSLRPWLDAEFIEGRADDGALAINQAVAGGQFEVAARESMRLGHQLDQHARRQSWTNGQGIEP